MEEALELTLLRLRFVPLLPAPVSGPLLTRLLGIAGPTAVHRRFPSCRWRWTLEDGLLRFAQHAAQPSVALVRLHAIYDALTEISLVSTVLYANAQTFFNIPQQMQAFQVRLQAQSDTILAHLTEPFSSSQTQIQQQTQQTQRRSLFSPYLPAASLPPLLAAGKLVIGVLRVNKRVRCRLLWRSAELARVLMCLVLLRTEPIRRLRRHRGSRCRHLRVSSAFTYVARLL